MVDDLTGTVYRIGTQRQVDNAMRGRWYTLNEGDVFLPDGAGGELLLQQPVGLGGLGHDDEA